MATINYSRVKVPELRKMIKALNAADLTKRPVATRGRLTRESMAEEFVKAIEECAGNNALDDVPEEVYNYYCSVMVPDEDDNEETPDVNENYVRDDIDDLVDEYRGKKRTPSDETTTEIPEDEGSLLDDLDEDSEEDEPEDEELEDSEEDEDELEEEDDSDEEPEDIPEDEPEEYEELEEEPEPPKRKRGRPKKVVTEKVEDKPKRKRGRPKKVATEEAGDRPKKRGRPPKPKTVTSKTAPKTSKAPRVAKPKKLGKTKPPRRAEAFFEAIQSKAPLTKDQIVDSMLEQGYSLQDNRADALFWTGAYLDLLVQIGIIEKRGEGKTAKYIYVG